MADIKQENAAGGKGKVDDESRRGKSAQCGMCSTGVHSELQ